MLLKSLLITLFSLFSLNSFAQDETAAKTYRHELGLNTTLLIKQVFSFNSNNIPFSPYLVTYRYTLNKKARLRAGAGILAQKTTFTQEDIDKRFSKSYNLDFRFGIEKQAALTDRWKAYYGVDITYTYNETLSESSFGSFNNQVKGFGAGPIAGIQFYLNKRISLFAEASLYYSDLNDRTVNISTSPFGQNSRTHSNILKGEIMIPTTLYLAFNL
jgi:hypothetical protein